MITEKKKKKLRRLKLKARQRSRRNLSNNSPPDNTQDSDPLLELALQSNSLKAYAHERQAQCRYRLYDQCTSPNCNLRCLTYLDMFGGSSSSLSSRNYNNNNRDSNHAGSSLFDTDIGDIENNINDPVALQEIISRQR